MALTTALKDAVNSLLAPLNVQIQTLTARDHEDSRLKRLADAGYFEASVFPVPACMAACDPTTIVSAVQQHRQRFETFLNPRANDVAYEFANDYFTSPDAEVLYAMIRDCRPRTLIEVGSGNSTRIARQAILDGGLPTKLIAVDPNPRVDVEAFADEWYRQPVETLLVPGPFGRLASDDILFIDSSHDVRPGNDCVFLFLRVLPLLPAGVVVHIHDVFLPFEYPAAWVRDERWPFAEQYLVQALLTFGAAFDVLWPGYYLQRTRADFVDWFPHARASRAQSLWLRKRA